MTGIDRSRDSSRPLEELNASERVKAESRYLRGTLEDSLADRVTGGLAAGDVPLAKFHGFYLQDDRDLRDERRRQKLEPAYQMMIRLRLPGGVVTTSQWRQLDEIADRFADGSLRLTTRQTFQLHGVLKHDIKTVMQAINALGLDTRGACGDINRTVMAAVNPYESAVHAAVYEHARTVSDHLAPRTVAYSEIWLDGERVAADVEEEPFYGPTYLPRKFKIGFAVPPVNDIDVYSQDLGFIAIMADDGALDGFNVCVGGGMGRTENEPATFPRLGDVIGFCGPEHVLGVAEAVVGTQRDHGDRVERTHARLKYTIEEHGLEWFKGEVEARLGTALEPAREHRFDHNGDRYGWVQGDDGRWHYTLFVENGRIRDTDGYALKSAIRAVAEAHTGELRLTPNQNLLIANVEPGDKPPVDALIAERGLEDAARQGIIRRNAMACVALPTCGLAMAESERYLPSLITRIETLAERAGVGDQPIVIRMSGCPNGCSRPYIAEIGFSGRAPGKYNFYLGGGFHGQRLNKLYLENVGEDRILEELESMFARYARERDAGEPFGDFVIRAGFVARVEAGRDFSR